MYCGTIKYTVLVVSRESESTQIKIDFVFMKTTPMKGEKPLQHRTNLRWWFRKNLWPSQNIWTLTIVACQENARNLRKMKKSSRLLKSTNTLYYDRIIILNFVFNFIIEIIKIFFLVVIFRTRFLNLVHCGFLFQLRSEPILIFK